MKQLNALLRSNSEKRETEGRKEGKKKNNGAFVIFRVNEGAVED